MGVSGTQSYSHQINTFKHPFKGCGEAKAEPQAFIDSNLKEFKNYMAYAYMVKRFIAAQRANKQLDISAAGAVQSTQTFENCIPVQYAPLQEGA